MNSRSQISTAEKEFSLPPSLLLRQRWVDETLRDFDRYRVLVVRAPRFGGKTSALAQLAHQLSQEGRPCYQLDFRSPIEPLLALKKMAQLLGAPISEHESDLIAIQEVLIEKLNQLQSVVIVDNFDFISKSSLYLETFIHQIRSGHFICSVSSLDDLNPEIALDIKISHYPDFSQEEIKAFIQQSHALYSPDELTPLTQRLHELTKGRPMILRNLIGAAVMEGRSLSLGNLETDLKNTEGSFYRRFLNSLPSSDLEALKRAAWIEDLPSLESKFLSSLSTLTLRAIETLGLVTRNNLSESLKREIRSWSSSEESTVREGILEYLEEATIYETKKERLRQLRSIGRLQEAARIFDEIYFEISSYGDSRLVLELSDGLAPHLAYDAMEFRRYIMSEMGWYSQILIEFDSRRETASSPEDNCFIEMGRSRALHNLDKLEEAQQSVKAALSLMPSSGLMRAMAIENAAWHAVKADPAKSLELYQEALTHLSEKDPRQTVFRFRLFFSTCYAYFCLGEAQKHRDMLIEIRRIAIDQGLGVYRVIADGALIDCEMSLGYYKLAMQKIGDFIERARKLAGHYVLGSILDVRIAFNNFQGKYAASEADCHQSRSIPNQFATADYFSERIVHSMVLRNQIPEAIDFLVSRRLQRSTSSAGSRHRDLRTFEDFLSRFQSGETTSLRGLLESTPIQTKSYVPLHSIALAASWRAFASIHDIYRYKMEEPASQIERLDQRSLKALHEVMDTGQIQNRERVLQDLQICRENDLWLIELRNILTLIFIEYFAGHYAAAKLYLSRGSEVCQLMEASDDVNLFWLISAMTHLRLNDRSNFQVALLKIQAESALSFAWTKFEEQLAGTSPPARLVPSEQAQKFIEKIVSSSKSTFDVILSEGSDEVIVFKEKVSFKDKALLKDLLRFLIIKSGSFFSKEELSVHLWHENYNPLIHDARIYTAVRRLREMLEGKGKWEMIETRAGRYGLAPQIRAQYVLANTSAPDAHLNERQKWILGYLKTHESMDRSTAQELLKSSRTPILRDLQDLVSRKLIRVEGVGKATRYMRA